MVRNIEGRGLFNVISSNSIGGSQETRGKRQPE
jgi:hypothetical protein